MSSIEHMSIRRATSHSQHLGILTYCYMCYCSLDWRTDSPRGIIVIMLAPILL
jgi:hypothetical protein